MGNSTIIVKTEQGDVTVHKMPLADYAQLLRALDQVPNRVIEAVGDKSNQELKDSDNSEFIAKIPLILAESWGDIISIISVPTDQDADFMSKLDFADAVDVVAAIVELNDIPRIIEAIKKMLALRAKIAPATPQK